MKKDNNNKHNKEEHNHDENEHNEGNHHEMMIKDFKKRFLISMIITIPVLLLSPMIQDWFNFSIEFRGSSYLLLALSTFIYFYGGWPFLTGFIDEIKEKNPGMMTLIAMAISVAFLYSAATVLGLEGSDFFWELATLIDIMLLGHWIEMRSVLSASNALDELAKLMPDEAHLMKDDEVVDVSVDELESGDRVLIKPGEKIPADGKILEGKSSIDESMLTGESVPVEKSEGADLIGGSVNGEGSLEIEIKNIGDDSYLSKVINLVESAQNSKSKSQDLANRAALWLTIIAITVGFTTLGVWLFLGRSFTFAIARMATVMVITCPHALGLATPLVVANSTALSAKNGLLIRNRTAFENARKIDTLVFDKTGTLTKGSFGVNYVQALSEEFSKEDIIQYAGTLEQNSEHPIALGILKALEEKDIEKLELIEFEAIKGKGVKGKIDEKDVKVVSSSFLKENDFEIPSDLPEHNISTDVFVIVNDNVIGVIGLSDQIRDESYDAIKALKKLDISCWMLTGDNESTAKEVSDKLNLDGYFAEVLPDQKQDKIESLQNEGKFVAMTGDGINDAPALAQADIGIAIGSGTDVAAETADIILVNSNPKDVLSLIKFGKATYRKMIQNLIWATGYNVVAIPLAAGVLYSFGILISPAIGAILMSLSTVIVAINAKLLSVE